MHILCRHVAATNAIARHVRRSKKILRYGFPIGLALVAPRVPILSRDF